MNMNTQPNTYLVRLYDEFTMMQTTRTMPTTPTTSKGLKAQQNRELKWAEKTYPNQIRYEVQPPKQTNSIMNTSPKYNQFDEGDWDDCLPDI